MKMIHSHFCGFAGIAGCGVLRADNLWCRVVLSSDDSAGDGSQPPPPGLYSDPGLVVKVVEGAVVGEELLEADGA